MEVLPELRLLSLQSNRIVEIGESLCMLQKLEEVYLSHNGITSMQGLQQMVTKLPHITNHNCVIAHDHAIFFHSSILPHDMIIKCEIIVCLLAC